MIKRLVGLEGDEIVHSDYSPEKPVTIGRGWCWVEGDNRDNSIDSNSAYGPISTGLIFGKVASAFYHSLEKLFSDCHILVPGYARDLASGRVA